MQEYRVTVGEFASNEIRFYKPGTSVLHRLDGPAIEFADGTKHWFQNGKYHRTYGPAVEYADGSKVWYQDDKRHRLDGPAVEYANGTKIWYIEGEKYTEEEFNKKIASLNTKEMTISEIEAILGHSVKVVK